MNIIEFLEARIAEDEAAAHRAERWADDGTEPHIRWIGQGRDSLVHRLGKAGLHIARHDPARVLAECAAKRAIIKQHEEWPVLVEREPEGMIFDANAASNMVYRMSREIAWLTEREYVKRFGSEPPTAPMIRTLAAIYSEHPDYQQEWA